MKRRSDELTEPPAADGNGGVKDDGFVPPLQVLRRHGVRASYRFGQNFLTDRRATVGIVESAGIGRGETVLEIGPGPCTLTRLLASRAHRVVALELDRRMAELARQETTELANVEVVNTDALRYDVEALASEAEAPLVVVGNLPYNVSGTILVRLLGFRRVIDRMVLTFQKEVADRIVAPPGNKVYGSLSVLCQRYCHVRLVMKLAPGVFIPAPKVWSAVVLFQMRPAPVHPVPDEDFFCSMVRDIFKYRRKALRNALSMMGVEDPTGCVVAAGIDPGIRPEKLGEAEFVRLCNVIVERGAHPAM